MRWAAALLLVAAACGTGDPDALRPLPIEPTQFPRSLEPGPTLAPDVVITDPIPGSELAGFSAADDTNLTGRIFLRGRQRGVVLLPPSGADMRVWYGFAQRLADAGYTAFAIDFRGHNQSEGERNPSQYPSDVLGAVRFLSDTGTEWIALVGAGVGGTAAVAAAPEADVQALALIDAEARQAGLDASQEAPRVDVPVLAVDVGADLARLLEDETVARPGTTDPQATALQDALLRFLQGH